MKTKSEELFEAFCKNNGIAAKKIPKTNTSTPDYEVIINSKLVICEIKQLDPTKEDLRENESVIKYRRTIMYHPLKRTSKKLLDVSRQVKDYADRQIPTIVVLYNNVPLHEYLSHDDILEAMFGPESNVVTFNKDGEMLNMSSSCHGGNRRFTHAHNTSVSAVAVLKNPQDGNLHMRLYHNNQNPKVKLDLEICKSLPINQYIYKKNVANNFGSWQQI